MAAGWRAAANVPAELTSFVGRRGEVAEVKRQPPGRPLVTLTLLRVVATSRESLIIEAETVGPAAPLVPPGPGRQLTTAELMRFPAASLLAQKAGQVVPGGGTCCRV